MRKQYTAAFKAQLVREVLKEEKHLNQIAAEHEVHRNLLTQWRDQALAGLPSLFSRQAELDQAAKDAAHTQQVHDLYAEIGKLSTHLAWLKKKLATSLTRAERLTLLERADAELPVRAQTDLLSLNRTSLYYTPVAPAPEEVALKHRIDTIATDRPYYGIRRISAQLRREGMLVNHKAVARHMREMGLAAIYPGPNLSKRAQQAAIYPYLLRHVPARRPNHIWGIDITYIRLRGGWMYLVAVVDWFSRYIVSWELDQSLAQPFVMAAVQRALAHATPAIWNSDQGSHFTSPQYTSVLLAAGVEISMDGKGRALDNIFVERLWRSVKYEEVYLHDYANPREARAGLTQYLWDYNHTRPHQALAYRTPAEVYD